MKLAYIYRITNILNNKMYIGYTHRNISKRWYEHIRDSLTRPERSYLHRAMHKHGSENFNLEVLYCSKDLKYTLNVMEPYFIGLYDTFNMGYNLTLGSEGSIGIKLTEKHKAILKKINTGKKLTQAAKNAISKNWLVIHPDGKEEIVGNLVPFCRKYNLKEDLMYSVARNTSPNKKSTYIRTHHKGFKCVNLSGDKKGI